jgi:hypothetical protein
MVHWFEHYLLAGAVLSLYTLLQDARPQHRGLEPSDALVRVIVSCTIWPVALVRVIFANISSNHPR